MNLRLNELDGKFIALSVNIRILFFITNISLTQVMYERHSNLVSKDLSPFFRTGWHSLLYITRVVVLQYEMPVV